jgi:N-acetylglucosaminyldiphosphoundecaprenol N-acetyl-beta-D-mannosaminyltransferase
VTITPQRLQIQGVRIDNVDAATALQQVDSYGRETAQRSPRIVFFVNVHSLHLARKDPHLLRCINTADLVLPDGSGLALAGRLFGHPIRENVNGTDFLPQVLAHARDHGWTVFFLGGKQDTVERCGKTIEATFPGIRIAGVHHGHCTEEERSSVTAQINALRPDILLVGMGTPVQESWIVQNAPLLATGICFGVGGLFDFLAGDKPRAPIWLRRAGLEWAFRFLHDPGGKWTRVMVEIPMFLGRLLGARILNRAFLIPETDFSNEPGRM